MKYIILIALLLAACNSTIEKKGFDAVEKGKNHYQLDKMVNSVNFRLTPDGNKLEISSGGSIKSDIINSREILTTISKELLKQSYDVSVSSSDVLYNKLDMKYFNFYAFKSVPLNTEWLEALFKKETFIIRHLNVSKAPVACLFTRVNDNLVCVTQIGMPESWETHLNPEFLEFAKNQLKEMGC